MGKLEIEACHEVTATFTRDLGPYPEIVKQHDVRRLFDNARTLAVALQRLTYVPETAHRMGQSAQATFMQNWTEEVAEQSETGAGSRRQINQKRFRDKENQPKDEYLVKNTESWPKI